MGNLLGREGCLKMQSEEVVEEAASKSKAFVEPPGFNRAAPLKWFADIEDYFEEFQICSDAAKCGVLIDTLDMDIIQLFNYLQLCGTINPPSDQRYETFKNLVLHTVCTAQPL